MSSPARGRGLKLMSDPIIFKSYGSSSKGNLYTVSDGETTVLLDPGFSVKQIKKRLDFSLSSSIDFALVSHEHMDHCAGAEGLANLGIDVFMGGETADNMKIDPYNIHRVNPFEQFTLGTWTVKAVPVPHMGLKTDPKSKDGKGKVLVKIPNLAYLMLSGENKFLFMIDCSESPFFYRNLTHVAIGVNYDCAVLSENMAKGSLPVFLGRRILDSHMSLQTAKRFLSAVCHDENSGYMQEIHLLHLSEKNIVASDALDEIRRHTGVAVFVHEG